MYHSLYRKYRPQGFESVVGQEIIIKTLQNSIKNNSFSHAYMFFGPRGTGKTTVSKILAKSINCMEPIDGMACGKCKNCLHSTEKECVDIIEIDAASNNGVDEIRELRNKISLVPAELNYKVYIIDEVHMLSMGAFNALLKTLEEPPSHAIFVLATTDPQKVPETIVSRCQCFSFKRISNSNIVDRLSFVCKEENIQIEPSVLNEIAIASDGGLRDALGMLDKLSSYSDSKITLNDFADLNGMITRNDLTNFVDVILSGHISEVLVKIDEYNSCGKNIIQVMAQVIYYLRDEIINFYVHHTKSKFSIQLMQKLINMLNEKMFDIKKSSNPVIYIEMLFIEFIDQYGTLTPILENSSLEPKPSSVENKSVSNSINVTQNLEGSIDIEINNQKIENTIGDKEIDNNIELSLENPLKSTSYKLNVKNIEDIMAIRINNTLAKANKNILKKELTNIGLFNDYTFDQEIGYIACSLLDAHIRAASDENLILSYEYDSIVEQNLANLNQIIYVYNKITNSNKKIVIITDSKWEKIKNQYILDLKDGKSYEILEEPDEIVEEDENNDIITNSAIELFGDIVEIE